MNDNQAEGKVLRNNIVASFAIKGFALVVSFLSTPAYISYFNDNAVLGVWFAVMSMLNWVLFFDFGLGNGLRNRLVDTIAKDRPLESRELVSSGYAALGAMTALIGLLFLFVSGLISWNSIFDVDSSVISEFELSFCLSVVVFGTLLQLWLRLITSVLYAYEKTALPSLVTLISNLAVLIAIMLPNSMSVNEKLIELSIVQVLSMNVPLLCISLWFFIREHPEIRPRLNAITLSSAKSVTYLGGKFFIVQILLMVISSTNEILISSTCSPSDVVTYSAYYRLFNLAVTLFSLIIQPMWSSMGKAMAERRYSWIKTIHNRCLCVALLSSAMCFAVIPLIPIIFSIWLGPNSGVEANATFALVFAALASCTLILNASTCVANATGSLSVQLYGLGAGAICKIPLSIALSSIGWLGIAWANVLCLIPVAIAQTIDSKRIVNQKTKVSEEL